MTVVPPYKSFSPSDFWFGCVQRLRQSVVGLAAQCTINVAGFNANGQEVASAVYTFTPALDPTGQASMIHAILPDTFHVPLSKMTMIEDGLTSSLWIDNLIYDISN